MKTTFSAILLFLSLITFGQDIPKDLIGKWKFKGVPNQEELDEQGLKMMKMFFSEMTFQFNSDSQYKAFMMGSEEQGNYIVKEGLSILLNSSKGHVVPIKIENLSPTEMTLILDGRPMIMSKLPIEKMEALSPKEPPYPIIAVTKEQITKKWYLKEKEIKNKENEFTKKAMAELLPGSYLHFKKKGAYHANYVGIKGSGTWQLKKENKVIQVTIDDQSVIWQIVSITDTELVLIKGLSPEKWTLSTNP